MTNAKRCDKDHDLGDWQCGRKADHPGECSKYVESGVVVHSDGLSVGRLQQILEQFDPKLLVHISGLDQDMGVSFQIGKIWMGGEDYEPAVFLQENEYDVGDAELEDEGTEDPD